MAEDCEGCDGVEAGGAAGGGVATKGSGEGQEAAHLRGNEQQITQGGIFTTHTTHTTQLRACRAKKSR